MSATSAPLSLTARRSRETKSHMMSTTARTPRRPRRLLLVTSVRSEISVQPFYRPDRPPFTHVNAQRREKKELKAAIAASLGTVQVPNAPSPAQTDLGPSKSLVAAPMFTSNLQPNMESMSATSRAITSFDRFFAAREFHDKNSKFAFTSDICPSQSLF